MHSHSCQLIFTSSVRRRTLPVAMTHISSTRCSTFPRHRFQIPFALKTILPFDLANII
uniref:Uncharacterized protein n=1 Tax=Glycine max TaxID=3847 RepID=A0A0R0KSY1_SOYBN